MHACYCSFLMLPSFFRILGMLSGGFYTSEIQDIIPTRCTRGDARSFFLYSQNVFVCTKRNFLQIYSNIVLKILLNCMNLQNMI